MRTAWLVALTMVIASCALWASRAQESASSPDANVQTKAILCDQEWRIEAAKGETATGSQHVTARIEVDKSSGKAVEQIVIEDTFALTKGDRQVGYHCAVWYSRGASPSPLRAATQTQVGAPVPMHATVTFAADSIEVKTTRWTDRKGDPLPAPREETRKHPLPKGAILFWTALPVMAPRVLEKAGDLKGVVLAEFPDDIDAPLNLKENCVLTRGPAKEDGTCEISLASKDGRKAWSGRFDTKGKCLEQETEKFRFVPVKEETKTPPASAPARP